MFLLGLPPELYTVIEAYPWPFGTAYCLFKTFLTEMTSSASILTIAAFTIERYLAICHSLRAQTTSALSRAIRVVVVVWIVACLTAIVYPIHTRTFYYLNDPRVVAQSTMAIADSTTDSGDTVGTPPPLLDSLICTIPGEWMPNMTYAFQVRMTTSCTTFERELWRGRSHLGSGVRVNHAVGKVIRARHAISLAEQVAFVKKLAANMRASCLSLHVTSYMVRLRTKQRDESRFIRCG